MAAAGTAFLIGRMQQVEPINADGNPITAADASRPPPLTREQTLADLIAGKPVSQFRTTDLPYLLENVSLLPPGPKRDELVHSLLFMLQNADPANALALVGKALSDPAERDAYIKRTLVMAASRDPQLALKELAKLPLGPQTPEEYAAVFDGWASDPGAAAAAAAAAAAIPIGESRARALRAVSDEWSREDPKAALDWASALPSTDSVALKQALIEAAAQQPALAAQYLGDLQDASGRAAAISAIAAGMAKTDPGAALDWLDQTATGAAYDNSVKSILASSARSDPAAAAMLLNKITDPGDRQAVIASLAGTWGKANPQAALAWAQTLPDADATSRSAALSSIVASWSKSDPAAALAFVQNSPDPTAYLAAAPTLAQVMAQTDPQAALAWANSLPAGAAKDQALSNVLVHLAQGGNFTDAWNTASGLPAGPGRDLAMSNVIAALSSSDPAKAASLLGQMDLGGANLTAVQTIATAWIQQDAQAATQWINGLPTGNQRDAAATQLVMAEIPTRPADAMALANSISGQKARVSAVLHVIKSWGKADPTAALAAAQTANVPADRRATIVQSIIQGQPPASGNNSN